METRQPDTYPETHGDDEPGDSKEHPIKPSVHRLMLKYINEAVRVEDLMYGPPIRTHMHPTEVHPEHIDHHQPREIINAEHERST